MNAARLLIAIGCEHKRSHRRQAARNVLQESQRRLIRPLQIIDNEKKRLFSGQTMKEVANSVE
jgi:hypothetical protein